MNFYFYLWLLKILWPENTSSHISRHLEFTIEQGHRVNWVSGSLDSRVTGLLGHKMWPSSLSDGDQCVWSPPVTQLAVIFRCALWEAYSASPDLLAEFKGRRKEEYKEGNGWNTGGAIRVDGKGTGVEKWRGIGIHTTRCSLPLFSRGYAYACYVVCPLADAAVPTRTPQNVGDRRLPGQCWAVQGQTRPSGARCDVVGRWMDGARFSVPLDTKSIISETYLPANLFARYWQNPNPTKLTT